MSDWTSDWNTNLICIFHSDGQHNTAKDLCWMLAIKFKSRGIAVFQLCKWVYAKSKQNNNNKAFKSETSWSRLELKPSRSNQGSGTWIAVFQTLLSKAKSLGIFHPFKSLFIASTQVNFGLSLPLFTLLSWLRIPLRTGASGGLRWTCPNHLNRCWTNFSSIDATPNLLRISSFRTRSLLVWPQIQHSAPYNIAGLIVVL